jgi:hypothetical protein
VLLDLSVEGPSHKHLLPTALRSRGPRTLDLHSASVYDANEAFEDKRNGWRALAVIPVLAVLTWIAVCRAERQSVVCRSSVRAFPGMRLWRISECDRDVPSGCFERPSYLMQIESCDALRTDHAKVSIHTLV